MKKIFKHLIATMLGLTLMLTTIIPVTQAEQALPDISEWAVETLNEGEKYGIYPIQWYYDDFRSEAPIEKVNSILALTEKKIAALQLSKNEEFTPVTFEENNTRGAIINQLFNIVARFDLPVGNDAVAYMSERKILVGDGNGLALEKNATTEEVVILATRFIKDTYHLAGQGSKGVAWVVEDEDTIVYLLGSIHLGTPGLYPYNETLLNAYNESDALFVEANILDPVGLQYFTEKAMYPEGATIEDAVSAETFAKLEKVAEQFQLSMEHLVNFKPWALTSDLTMLTMDDSYGITPMEMSAHGIDMYFLLNALIQGKPVFELEGVKQQADMFDALSPETQEQSLVEVLDSILEPSQSKQDPLHDWFIFWSKGDDSAFTESFLANVGENQEYNEMLFGARDEQMAQEITSLLENEAGTFFIVVGAGHFIVDKNIRYHLEQNGYTVKPFYQ